MIISCHDLVYHCHCHHQCHCVYHYHHDPFVLALLFLPTSLFTLRFLHRLLSHHYIIATTIVITIIITPPHHHQHSIIITTIINITIITTLITITTTNPRTKGITLTCHIRRRRGIHLPYVFLSKSAKTTQLKFNLRIEKRFGSRNSFHHFHAPDDPSLRQNSQRKLSNRLLSAHSENLSTLIFFRNYWLIEFLLIIFYYLK